MLFSYAPIRSPKTILVLGENRFSVLCRFFTASVLFHLYDKLRMISLHDVDKEIVYQHHSSVQVNSEMMHFICRSISEMMHKLLL